MAFRRWWPHDALTAMAAGRARPQLAAEPSARAQGSARRGAREATAAAAGADGNGADDGSDGPCCVICGEASSSHVLKPCGHKCAAQPRRPGARSLHRLRRGLCSVVSSWRQARRAPLHGRCVCDGCAAQLVSASDAPLCPVCDAPIRDVVRVFLRYDAKKRQSKLGPSEDVQREDWVGRLWDTRLASMTFAEQGGMLAMYAGATSTAVFAVIFVNASAVFT